MKQWLMGMMVLALTIPLAAQDSGAEYRPKKEDPVLKRLQQANKDAAKTLKQLRKDHEQKLEKEKEANPPQRYWSTFEGIAIPENPDRFQKIPHLPPVAQYLTGTCWSFATTSFFESEILRIHSREVKLSEIHTAYYEYIEKVRRWVQEYGHSEIGEGSEQDAVIHIWKQYGVVPASVYNGITEGAPEHNHALLFKELRAYLDFVQDHDLWYEDTVLNVVRDMLNRHLGKPPIKFEYQGKTYTPETFRDQVVQLDLDDYVAFCSFQYAPFWQTCEFKVPDNWRHTKTWHNVPLDVFYGTLKRAVDNGFTVAIGGDVSESGYDGTMDAAFVSPFDIPEACINQDAREFRFANRTSTDDHLVHVVGHTKLDNHDWYLIKDSARSARKGRFEGYLFYREDYIKLKTLVFLVHRDAVDPAVLERFQSPVQ